MNGVVQLRRGLRAASVGMTIGAVCSGHPFRKERVTGDVVVVDFVHRRVLVADPTAAGEVVQCAAAVRERHLRVVGAPEQPAGVLSSDDDCSRGSADVHGAGVAERAARLRRR